MSIFDFNVLTCVRTRNGEVWEKFILKHTPGKTVQLFLGTCQNCRVGLNCCCQLLWLLFLCSVLSRPQVGIPVRPLDWLQCLMFRITTQKTSIINGRSEDCWGFSLSLSFGLQLIHSHGLSKCKAIFNFLNSSGLLYSIGLDVRMKHYFFLDLIQFCTITRDTSGQVQLEIL